MALADLFRTRKSAKLHRQAWQILWERVKTPLAADAAARELHVVFVGMLLYATRYQTALAAGMESTIAKTLALQVVGDANFDEPMRDRVLSVFSASPANRAADYAEHLNSAVAALVAAVGSSGGAPPADVAEGLLQEIEDLLPELSERLCAES